MADKKDPRLKAAGVSGYNKPKATPDHPTKSHIVVAKEGDQIKTIRFGQQGVKGSPDGSKRNEAFKARHAKNIAKGRLTALRTLAEESVEPNAKDMASDLLKANEAMVDRLNTTFKAATDENEQGIANFIAERIDMHQKWCWFLRASLKV